MSKTLSLPADPYRWPFDTEVELSKLAVIVIDMQTDFCGRGGYVDRMGYDLSLTRAAVEPLQNVLAAVRQHPEIMVIHTREGHRPE